MIQGMRADRVSEELWTKVQTLYRRQGSRPSPKKKNVKRQNGCLRRQIAEKIVEKEETQKVKKKRKDIPI